MQGWLARHAAAAERLSKACVAGAGDRAHAHRPHCHALRRPASGCNDSAACRRHDVDGSLAHTARSSMHQHLCTSTKYRNTCTGFTGCC